MDFSFFATSAGQISVGSLFFVFLFSLHVYRKLCRRDLSNITRQHISPFLPCHDDVLKSSAFLNQPATTPTCFDPTAPSAPPPNFPPETKIPQSVPTGSEGIISSVVSPLPWRTLETWLPAQASSERSMSMSARKGSAFVALDEDTGVHDGLVREDREKDKAALHGIGGQFTL